MNAFFVLCLAAAAVAEPWNLYSTNTAGVISPYSAGVVSPYAAGVVSPSVFGYNNLASKNIYSAGIAQPALYQQAAIAQPALYQQAGIYQPLVASSYKAQVGDKLIQSSPGNKLITKIQKREAEADPLFYTSATGIYQPSVLGYQQVPAAVNYAQVAYKAPIAVNYATAAQVAYKAPVAVNYAAAAYQPAATVQNHAATHFNYADKNNYIAKSAGNVIHMAKREAEAEADPARYITYGSTFNTPLVGLNQYSYNAFPAVGHLGYGQQQLYKPLYSNQYFL